VAFLILISSGNALKKRSPHEVENILLSRSTTTQVSVFVLINLQNHCLSLIIAFGTEYSKNGSSKNTLLA